MSNRTAAATKAVNDAWEKERELVQIGKGTRDWTQKQQEEILERGRAYYHSDDPNDKDDGKAFEGHHMKSVEAYPEFQGDSDNIQFLSRPEHKEAHRGAYKNASNWYFDPVTHEFTDFGEEKYIPCAVIDLSHPIIVINVNAEKNEFAEEKSPPNNAEEQQDITEDDDLSQNHETETSQKSTHINKDIHSKVQPTIPSSEKNWKDKIKGGLKTVGKKVGKAVKGAAIYVYEHPEEAQEWAATAITSLIDIGRDIKTQRQINRQRTNSAHTSKNMKSIPSNNKTESPAAVPTATKKITPDNKSAQKKPVATKKSDDQINRTSPKEHTVKAHQQRYHTKEGIKVVDKDSFSRGGKKKVED